MLGGKTWYEFRAGLPNPAPTSAAVGYRFDIPGRWPEPQYELLHRVSGTPEPKNGNVEIDTVFKDRFGADCGKFRVNFQYARKYLVDNSDLADLLNLITSWAAVAK
jgi:hypothetical protein